MGPSPYVRHYSYSDDITQRAGARHRAPRSFNLAFPVPHSTSEAQSHALVTAVTIGRAFVLVAVLKVTITPESHL